MFKLQSPSKYFPFNAIYPLRLFSHCSKQFLNLLILMPFSASAIFCFTSSTSAKCFPLRTFFIQGNKRKSLLGWDLVNREDGTRESCSFLVKNCWTLSLVWAGPLINHPSWNGQMHWVFKENSLKPNTASHNNASWYTDTDGFLEHSPSGGSLYYKGPTLQKIITVFGGCPLIK